MEEVVKLPVTVAWLERFRLAYDALPQGEKQRMAEFAGCSGSMLSRIYAGEAASSDHLAKISEYLKIAPPAVVVNGILQARIAEATDGLPDDDLEMILAQIVRLKR